ncbi:hypothetical protein PsYK624_156500 [Phanerochaete sordida]|uniref:Uncharacterized protein n=1 Tax=Phanerochaete sordida TaxID=48140 RepID=A0A9P3GQP5_9APHY|nr:hypothetical protein PsYK624_156500 [Phanerochaete sordida]
MVTAIGMFIAPLFGDGTNGGFDVSSTTRGASSSNLVIGFSILGSPLTGIDCGAGCGAGIFVSSGNGDGASSNGTGGMTSGTVLPPTLATSTPVVRRVGMATRASAEPRPATRDALEDTSLAV